MDRGLRFLLHVLHWDVLFKMGPTSGPRHGLELHLHTTFWQGRGQPVIH